MIHRVVGGRPGGFRDGDFTGFASETIGTQAVIVIDAVVALSSIFARLAGAVIDVDGAETPFKAHLALAGEAVDPIKAGGTIGTGTHQAVIHVVLTESPHEASKAPAGEVAGKAIFILALPTILAWRPVWREHGRSRPWRASSFPCPTEVNTRSCRMGSGPGIGSPYGGSYLKGKTEQEFPPPEVRGCGTSSKAVAVPITHQGGSSDKL